MNAAEPTLDLDFVTPLARRLEQTVPDAAVGAVLVLSGAFVAWIVTKSVGWICRRAGLDEAGQRLGVSGALQSAGLRRPLSSLLGLLAGIVTLGLFLISAAEVTELHQVAETIQRGLAFVPSLAAALLILLGGLALAAFLRGSIVRSGGERGLEQPDGVATFIYYSVVTVAGLMAIDQLGLDADLVHKLVLIVAGLSTAGLALAFGLGNADVLRGMSAKQYLKRVARPGDELVLDDRGVDAVVLRYAGICVVLRASDGELVLPCAQVLSGSFRVRAITEPPRSHPPDEPQENSTSQV